MVEEITPVLPPGVADRFIETYLLVPLLAVIALCFLRRVIRDLKFSEDDIGTRWVSEGSEEPVGSVANLLLDGMMVLFLGGFAAVLI